MNVKQVASICVIMLLLAAAMVSLERNTNAVQTNCVTSGYRIIVDPGHGGDDPGAVSDNGTREADINLRVAVYLREYLLQAGVEAVLTRGEEGLTREERIQKITDENCDAVISIHMNKFSDSSVHGAETFYYSGSEQSKIFAECVQSSMKNELDSTNKRTIKATTSLFVLKASKAPSILVECGYISNETEEIKLRSTEYQKRIAYSIYCGIMSFLQT